jgi:hypothetical protein
MGKERAATRGARQEDGTQQGEREKRPGYPLPGLRGGTKVVRMIGRPPQDSNSCSVPPRVAPTLVPGSFA